MSVKRILKFTSYAAVVVVSSVFIAGLWLYPSSPVGRCARHPWPADFESVGAAIEDIRVDTDGRRRVRLFLWDRSPIPQALLIRRLPLPFHGLSEGSIIKLDTRPTVFTSEPVPEETNISVMDSLSYVLMMGGLKDPTRLPAYLEGVYPVSGRSRVSQLEGSGVESGTHFYNNGNLHAVDIAAPIGTPVVATRPGRVVRVSDGFPDFPCGKTPRSRRAKFGNFVMIEDDSGLWMTYAHLQNGSIKVGAGQRVSAGQQIAAIGKSGAQWAGPHLHISAGGAVKDPAAGYWVTVPLRFRVCGDKVPARSIRLDETVVCPAVSMMTGRRN